MKLAPKNWYLTSYVNNTWTSVISETEPVIIASMVMANTSGSSVTVRVRLGDLSGNLVTIIPGKELLGGESFTIDLRSVNILPGQSLEVSATAAGAEILLSGVINAEV